MNLTRNVIDTFIINLILLAICSALSVLYCVIRTHQFYKWVTTKEK